MPALLLETRAETHRERTLANWRDLHETIDPIGCSDEHALIALLLSFLKTLSVARRERR